MLISVIITCYNLEKYIAEAIDSIINQDCDPLLYEVVVVDDCSTDRSAEIIKTYSRVRYLRTEQNCGVLMATVIGLENTSGELVFFLDGDDIWEPGKLAAVVDRFTGDSRLALVTHDLQYIDSDGKLLDRNIRPEEVMASVSPSQESAMTRDGILLHSDYVWLGSAYAVHRRLGNVPGFCAFAKSLPEPFNTYQDWPLAFWVACQREVGFGYVPRKLFRYRLHGANHSGDATSVVKAIRNVRRTQNTMQAMREIAIRFNAEARVLKVTDAKLRFYTYLDDLYNARRWAAIRGFFASLPYLITGTSPLLKEVVRFLGVQVFGLEQFIALAARRTRRPACHA